MAVQARRDNDTEPLILTENSLVRNGTIIQDAGRTTDLLFGTVLAKIAASGLYTPFVSLTATTGASVPCAIYLGDDIDAADLVAGNIVDVPILVGNAVLDEGKVVFDDGTLSAASIVPAAAANPYFVLQARECLSLFGLFLELGIAISEHEN
jgi:hypothetical protein